MATSDELRVRLAAWEREHPDQDPERVHFALTHDSASIEDRFPPLTKDEIYEVAGLWEEYKRQRSRERITKTLVDADRAEALADDIARRWSS